MPPTAKKNHQNVVYIFKETVESLVVAFILAFVFRAFVAEAFIIPTGSMADTLRGDHFELTCQKCGYQYNYGFIPEKYHMGKGAIPNRKVHITNPGQLRAAIPICPACGTKIDDSNPRWVSKGDRILVLKYLYQFAEPQIWDVVVFKNPTNPQENYIKRLIGKPEQKVEIIDGDVYINDQIQRKPPHIQNTLWLTAFDNNYQPENSPWKQPFIPSDKDTNWQLNQSNATFTFNGAETADALIFNPQRLKETLESFCAYNGPLGLNGTMASDLKLAFTLNPKGTKGYIAFKLGKYGRLYTGIINFDGICKIIDESSGETLQQGQFAPLQPNHPVEVSFANVDHRLTLCMGNEKLIHDGPNDAHKWGYQPDKMMHLPQVQLSASGDPFTLKNIILYRDTHYTQYTNGSATGRGTEGKPIKLEKDQFFVMGDNSPQSYDSRFWAEDGIGNGEKRYRQGIVPREYLIGKAFFVYWPSGFHPYPNVPLAVVPNAGKMRFIH